MKALRPVKKVFALLLFVCLSVSAQTREQLRGKYGPPESASYVVRPGVVLTASFGKDGRAFKMMIEPAGRPRAGGGPVEPMPAALVKAVLDELLPAEGRGAFIRSVTFSAGCTSVGLDDYEAVKITRVTACAPGEGVLSASILRKQPE